MVVLDEQAASWSKLEIVEAIRPVQVGRPVMRRDRQAADGRRVDGTDDRPPACRALIFDLFDDHPSIMGHRRVCDPGSRSGVPVAHQRTAAREEKW